MTPLVEHAAQPRRRAQPWLGTLVEVTIHDVDHALDSPAFNAAFAAIRLVHQTMSFHDPASDISRFNRATIGEPVGLSAGTADVLQFALQLAVSSEGMFDIACAPRLVEWGYLPAPSTDLPTPGFSPALLRLQGLQVYKTAPAWIDVGGIAKGYAVDQAVAALQNAGVSNGCVNAGGDLRVFGEQPQYVRVRNPFAPDRLLPEQVLYNEAMATSGHYFSQQQCRGEWISALVDARGAWPLTTSAGASVRASTCMVADGLTKVVMASGDSRHPACLALGASAIHFQDQSTVDTLFLQDAHAVSDVHR